MNDTLTVSHILIAIILLAIFAVVSAHCQQDLQVQMTAAVNQATLGQFVAGALQGISFNQAAKAAAGYGVQYRYWLGPDGAATLSYGWIPSSAKLCSGFLNFCQQWPITRHEFQVSYQRRLRSAYVEGGIGEALLNGSHFSGFEIITGGGFERQLGARMTLISGARLLFVRSPNFGDDTYHAGRGMILEPRVGLAWSWGQPTK